MDVDFSFEIGAMPPKDNARFEKFWAEFSKEAAGSQSAKSEERVSFRKEISRDYQAGFDAMELLHESASEAINWASGVVHDALEVDDVEDDAFAEYINVLVGLGGRALLAFDEVAWLLRGGYPYGAWTRVRSLQELFIVAATLGLYGSPGGAHPDLVERYLSHHEVFTRTMADELLATESDGVEETLNGEVLQALARKRAALIENYGKTFAGPWGWAAPLFPQSNPTFTALSKLILPSFNAFYGIASSHLHASSQGLIEAAKEAEGGDRYFLVGSQKDGLGAAATLGSGFLIGVLGAIIPTSMKFPDDPEPNNDGYFFLSALVRIQEQVRMGMDKSGPQRSE